MLHPPSIKKYSYLPTSGDLLRDRPGGSNLLMQDPAWDHIRALGSAWDRLLVRERPVGGYVPRYMDLRANYTFQRVFHTEVNKDLLIHFLNSLFAGRKTIKEVEFLPTERQGEDKAHRTVIYDVLCKGSDGAYFLIEMQRAGQDFFENRMLYYGCRLVSSHVPSGKAGDRYDVKEIFVIGILDFELWDDAALMTAPTLRQNPAQRFLRRVNMSWTDTHEQFGPVEWIFIQLPRFDKPASLLDNDFDRWLYLMKHLGEIRKEPPRFKAVAFEKLYDLTAIKNLTGKEFDMYMLTFDRESEWENTISHATRKGRQEGEKLGRQLGEAIGEERAKQQEKLAFVQTLLKDGIYDDQKIASLVGVEERFVSEQRRIQEE